MKQCTCVVVFCWWKKGGGKKIKKPNEWNHWLISMHRHLNLNFANVQSASENIKLHSTLLTTRAPESPKRSDRWPTGVAKQILTAVQKNGEQEVATILFLYCEKGGWKTLIKLLNKAVQIKYEQCPRPKALTKTWSSSTGAYTLPTAPSGWFENRVPVSLCCILDDMWPNKNSSSSSS